MRTEEKKTGRIEKNQGKSPRRKEVLQGQEWYRSNGHSSQDPRLAVSVDRARQ